MHTDLLIKLKIWLRYKYITARDIYNDSTRNWSQGYKKAFEETLDYIEEIEKEE